MQLASVTLTAAQIKALKGTPAVLVAAPGDGKGIYIVGWQVQYVPGAHGFTTPDANTSLVLIPAAMPTTGIFSYVFNYVGVGSGHALDITTLTGLIEIAGAPNFNAGSLTSALLNNQALVATHVNGNSASSGEITVGDGSLVISVAYAEVPVL